jgi:hypothetical protein
MTGSTFHPWYTFTRQMHIFLVYCMPVPSLQILLTAFPSFLYTPRQRIQHSLPQHLLEPTRLNHGHQSFESNNHSANCVAPYLSNLAIVPTQCPALLFTSLPARLRTRRFPPSLVQMSAHAPSVAHLRSHKSHPRHLSIYPLPMSTLNTVQISVRTTNHMRA